MSEHWKVDNPDQLSERLGFFENYLRASWDWSTPVTWQVKPWTRKRSLNANALLHVWFREIANELSNRGQYLSEERAKLLLCHKFLGTEDFVYGRTVIESQVRHTSSLSPGEMKEFMDQLIAWCSDHDILLSHPTDSEYYRWNQSR